MNPLSAIQAIMSLYNLYNMMQPPKAPQAPPTLSWDEARRRAESVLNPSYRNQMQTTLKAVDNRNIQRGFFGQAPGAALSRSTAAQVERDRIGAVSGLTSQMVGQSETLAAQYALEAARNRAAWQSGLGSNLAGWQNGMGTWMMGLLDWANNAGSNHYGNMVYNPDPFQEQGYGQASSYYPYSG